MYNQKRIAYGDVHIDGFEWYMEHHFYTSEALGAMCEHTLKLTDLLSHDAENEKLIELKNHFHKSYRSISFQNDLDTSSQVHLQGDFYRKVIDFYNPFVLRIKK